MLETFELMVIIPSRGRPRNLRRVVEAWRETGAFDDGAALLISIDDDDPARDEYLDEDRQLKQPGVLVDVAARLPMAKRTNRDAGLVIRSYGDTIWAVGSAGDDHMPRTRGWARQYLTELAAMGTGIVYGDDGYQGAKLCTEWAMTADIVRTLGRMIPAPVDHLYADNSVHDLGHAAGCIRHLPDVRIEHVHPAAKKTEWDDGYRRVNAKTQYRRDGGIYKQWKRTGLAADVALLRALREDSSGS